MRSLRLIRTDHVRPEERVCLFRDTVSNSFSRPVVKVQIAEKHPSGAKAHRLLSTICGTTKVVRFQNLTFTTGCYGFIEGRRAFPG